jgi:hypothetical protein
MAMESEANVYNPFLLRNLNNHEENMIHFLELLTE